MNINLSGGEKHFAQEKPNNLDVSEKLLLEMDKTDQLF